MKTSQLQTVDVRCDCQIKCRNKCYILDKHSHPKQAAKQHIFDTNGMLSVHKMGIDGLMFAKLSYASDRCQRNHGIIYPELDPMGVIKFNF